MKCGIIVIFILLFCLISINGKKVPFHSSKIYSDFMYEIIGLNKGMRFFYVYYYIWNSYLCVTKHDKEYFE